MKILVIGNGFIAKSIIQRFESEGHEILVFARTLNIEILNQQVLGDIFDFEDFLKTLSWVPQIVVHTAWVTTPAIYRNDLSNHKYAQFTSDLAKCLVHTNVEHLIVLGTCAEYGHQSEPSTAGVTKLFPNTLYARQKVAAFNATKKFLQESSVRLTWARIFYPYGPNQDQKRLIPHLIHSLKNGDLISLTDTLSIHDWITTRDIASAISWVTENVVPMEIDVGTTFGFTNVEILKHLEELLGSTTQWTKFTSQTTGGNDVSIVGKESPLLKSGWLPSDSLNTGLEWVLSS